MRKIRNAADRGRRSVSCGREREVEIGKVPDGKAGVAVLAAGWNGGMFHRHPNIRFVPARCGGALPGLSGRTGLLGSEAWVPGAAGTAPGEVRAQLGRP